MPEKLPFLHRNLNKARLTLLIAVVFTLLAAGVFRTPSIVFMAALLLGAPALGIFIGRAGSRRLGITRTLPSSGTVGDVFEGSLTLHNHSRWPALLIHVRCGEGQEEDEAAASSILLDAASGADEAIQPIAAEGSDEHIVTLLAGHASTSWRQSWRLQRRGVFQLVPARAGMLDPLGLQAALTPKTKPQKIVVLPRPVPITRMGLLDGASSGDTMPRYATVVADAMDFHGVRPWMPGEAIRRIHWKSTARTGKLHVIEWEENVASDLAILLDTQAASIAGRAGDDTLEICISLAASIAAYLLESGYRLQFICWQPSSVGATKDREGSKLRLVHHEAGNAGGLGPTLDLLARLKPTTDERATLPSLISKSAALRPSGRRTLLLASTLSELDEALSTLPQTAHSYGSSSEQAIVADAASFDDSIKQSTLPEQLLASVRMVRRGDSLSAILEQ